MPTIQVQMHSPDGVVLPIKPTARNWFNTMDEAKQEVERFFGYQLKWASAGDESSLIRIASAVWQDYVFMITVNN